jgi:DNA-binding PadR family transcriptional regulator
MPPPPKGNLAAIKAILSLFLDGPDTHAGIKDRLRREFPHASWSRSIVNSSLPALVTQGLIVLIASGEQRGEDLYEITEAGIADFRRWMREAPRSTGPLREPLQVWIEHSTPDELPHVLAVVRETEREATKKVAEAQKHLNSERTLGRLGPADGSDYPGRVRYAMLTDTVKYWEARVNRCKVLRMNLRGGRDMHTRRPVDDHG